MSSVMGGRLRGLGRLTARLGPQATGLRGLLAWWGHALAAWLPVRLRHALGVDRGRLLLQVAGDDVLLRLQRASEIRELAVLPFVEGDVPVDALASVLSPAALDLPRWLLVPAASSLCRRLQLPAAAADRLRDVVRFEIDRQTPFAAEAVLFDARLLGRRVADGQLDVELVAAPRALVEPQLATVAALAGRLAGIDVIGPDGEPRGVNLLDAAERGRQRDAWQLWNRVLVAISLLAVAATLFTVLENRRAAADALDAEVRARSVPARAAAAQREALVALVNGQAFLDLRRSQLPTAVEVMDELTRRLPDGTYLEKLALEDDRMTLIGLSNEAPSLITRLEGSTLWTSPALAGALQPDPATGRDRFTLTANLKRIPAAPGAKP